MMAPAATGQAADNHEHDILMSIAMAVADGFQSLALAADSGKVEDVGGAVCWYSSSSVPLFNGAGLFSEGLFNAGTIKAIEDYFAERGHPFCLVTLDGLVPDAYERLREFSYVEFDSSPAMLLEGPAHRWLQEPSGLWVARVQSPVEMAAFRSVLSRVFAISAEEITHILSDRLLQASTVLNYLGWLDGEPVATGTMVLAGSIPGVWNVGTLPVFRRQGLAAEIMHRLVTDAARLGYPSTMLLSSADGLPLYARLGYRFISEVRMFASVKHSVKHNV